LSALFAATNTSFSARRTRLAATRTLESVLQFRATDSLLPASFCHQLPELVAGAQPQLLRIHSRHADDNRHRLIVLGDNHLVSLRFADAHIQRCLLQARRHQRYKPSRDGCQERIAANDRRDLRDQNAGDTLRRYAPLGWKDSPCWGRRWYHNTIPMPDLFLIFQTFQYPLVESQWSPF